MESRSFPANCELVRRSLSLLTVAAMLASPLTSFAQGRAAVSDEPAVGAEPAAKTKFADALKLYKSGNVAEALPLFREVVESTHSPNAELYVGYCLAQSGKRADAYKAFTLVLKQISEHPDEKYEPTREAAEAQLAILNVRLAKLVILIVDTPAGLAVTLDGVTVEEKTLGSSIVVEPGTHRIEASASGISPVRRDVSLEGGELKTLNLSLKKSQEGQPSRELTLAPAAAPATGAPPAAEAKHPTRTAGYVTGAVGVAGLAVFAITGMMAKSTFNTLQRECGGAGCSDAGHLGDVDRGKSLQTVANVGLVVGLVGVAAGGTMILLGGGKKETGARAWLSPGGGMVSYGGAF